MAILILQNPDFVYNKSTQRQVNWWRWNIIPINLSPRKQLKALMAPLTYGSVIPNWPVFYMPAWTPNPTGVFNPNPPIHLVHLH